MNSYAGQRRRGIAAAAASFLTAAQWKLVPDYNILESVAPPPRPLPPPPIQAYSMTWGEGRGLEGGEDDTF